MPTEITVPFSARIRDRHKRWWKEKAKVTYKQVGGKIAGRRFAEKMGCRVPDLYSVLQSAEQIPSFETLPRRFVIKPAIGWSAQNVFVLDHGVNLFDNRRWDRTQIIDALSSVSAGTRILIEEFLQNWDGKPGIPLDYKFYTFADRIAIVHVIERNSAKNLGANRHWYFDADWNPIHRRVVTTQVPETAPISKPDCYPEMLDMVQRMGRKLDMFMRIDMYATTRGAVFGEFTPQPHGGHGFTPWADEWLGRLWRGIEGNG